MTVSAGDFNLTWDLMSFLTSPEERGTYQMSLMSFLIEKHLYHSLKGNWTKVSALQCNLIKG